MSECTAVKCLSLFHSESLLVFVMYFSCYFDQLHLHHQPTHQDHDYDIHYDSYPYVSVNRWWHLLWSEITPAFMVTTGAKMDVSWSKSVYTYKSCHD